MSKHFIRSLPIAVSLFTAHAAAQESEPTGELPSAMPVQLEEVVVTATKRTENVRDIPASIATLSGEELEQRAAQETADIVKLVPGVNVTSTGDSPQRVTIRGISSDIGTSSTTGTLFGNVSFSEAYVPVLALDPNPFDMASVEVLKGPQGTLYGASALNGAVRYVPVMPKFGQYEAKYFGQYTWIHDGDAAPSYGGAVNVPMGDDLALRVMAFDRVAPGYVDNQRRDKKDVNRTDQQGARALLGWRPGDSWDVLLTTAWQSTLLRDVGIADSDDGTLETNNRTRPSPNKTRYSLIDLAVTYDAEWAQLVSDTSYVDKRGDNRFDATSRELPGSPVALTAQEYAGQSSTFGQEFRLVSANDADSRWKWTAGLFGWQQDVDSSLMVPLAVDVTPLATILDLLSTVQPGLASLFSPGGSPLVLASVADVRVRELAAFGDLTRKFGDDVEVTAGGRFYRTSSGGTNTQSGAFVLAQRGSSPYVLEDEVKETGFNPKVSALWHINDDILTYALVSKGFRVGGVQSGITTPLSQNAAPNTFKSDSLWNYEGGLRTQWLDKTLRLDLTGYYVDWKKPQSLQQDASGLAVYVDNVGGVHSVGTDLSLQYLFPWAGLMLTTTASYADTTTSEPFTTSSGDVLPSGTRWPLAPKWQTASNLSFLRPVGDWIVGGFATYTFIGPTVPYLTGERVFDYHQIDLQLSLSNERYRWLPQIALICNNLTDERGLTNRFSSNLPTEATAAKEFYYITPRAMIVRLSGTFGN